MVERFHSVRTTNIDESVTDEQATFEVFFREEHARLYRALCMVVGSRDEAEEIAQDAFLRLWERWDRVSRMEAPTAYLFQVAMNVFRSRYRSTVRAMRRTLAQRPEADALAAIEDRDVVVRLLKRLTPQQRAAVVLTNLLGYSSEEAGRLLKMPAGTVRALSTRARAALRETAGERP
jgi:RNA polymerase sigma-70 factor (ECF subfamily)